MSKPTRTFTVLAGRVIVCALASASGIHAQTPRNPLTKDAVIRLLKGDVPPKRVGEMARQRGIDFAVTPSIEERFEVLHTGGRSSLHTGRGELVITNGRVKYESHKDQRHEFDVPLSEVTDVEVGAPGSGAMMFQRPLILWVRGEKYFLYVRGGRGPEDALSAIKRAKGER